MTTNALTNDSAPAQGDLERDQQMEVLLDDMVMVSRGDELPADFTVSVLVHRPWAPWEVSRASYWRLSAGVGLGLLAGSLGFAVTPLWSLGPGTAFTVWTELVAVAFGRPVASLVMALPLLAEGAERAARAVPPGAVLLLGVAAGVSAASFGVALARLRRPASSISPRRG